MKPSVPLLSAGALCLLGGLHRDQNVFQVRSASRALSPAQFASSATMLALGGQVQNAYGPSMDVVLNADNRPPIQQMRGPLSTKTTISLSYTGSRLVVVTVLTDGTVIAVLIFNGKTVPLPLAKAASSPRWVRPSNTRRRG